MPFGWGSWGPGRWRRWPSASRVNFLLIALGSGFSVAGSVLVAQNFGARHLTMVNHVATQALVLETGLALVLTAVAHFASPYILHLLGAGPDIFEQAISFSGCCFGAAVQLRLPHVSGPDAGRGAG